MRLPLIRTILAFAALSTPLAAQVPQDSVEPEATGPPAAPGDALSIARAAVARGDPAEALSQYLRVLSTQPNDVEALSGAGRAALAVGDLNAATGFFARADDLAPNDGAVKAGLGAATVQSGNARAALRYFRQALAAGVPEAAVAADRGLAYDLNGDNRRAQAQYQLALRATPGDPTVVRRLALSQAIAGDVAGALATLDPLLRRQDIPAWRTRAFAKAVSGDPAGAEADAALVLPPNQVATIRPYLVRLAALKPADKAAAVFLGRFPSTVERRTVVARADPAPARRSIVAPIVSAFSLAPKAGPGAVPETPPPPPVAAAPFDPVVETVETSPALRAHMRAVAAADRATKLAEARAAQKQRADRAKTLADAKAKRSNPARHWVQVAGGANWADLPRAWTQLKAKWPGQLAGRTPWSMPFRFTNRLLIGPFSTSDAAQDWVSSAKTAGMPSFRVETNAGDPVARL